MKTAPATKMLYLPEDAEELADFADFSAAYLTVNRTPDGTVYLTRWWFGTAHVVLIVSPDGSTQKVDDE